MKFVITGGKPELVATLNGHSEKVVSLAWSPHFHGRLLSASYDCTYKVNFTRTEMINE